MARTYQQLDPDERAGLSQLANRRGRVIDVAADETAATLIITVVTPGVGTITATFSGVTPADVAGELCELVTGRTGTELHVGGTFDDARLYLSASHESIMGTDTRRIFADDVTVTVAAPEHPDGTCTGCGSVYVTLHGFAAARGIVDPDSNTIHAAPTRIGRINRVACADCRLDHPVGKSTSGLVDGWDVVWPPREDDTP